VHAQRRIDGCRDARRPGDLSTEIDRIPVASRGLHLAGPGVGIDLFGCSAGPKNARIAKVLDLQDRVGGWINVQKRPADICTHGDICTQVDCSFLGTAVIEIVVHQINACGLPVLQGIRINPDLDEHGAVAWLNN